MFAHCPVTNCLLTANRSLLPSLHQYDALLFHSWKMFAADVAVPPVRSSHQHYLLFSIESFSHCAYLTPWEETVLAGFFNFTFSFRKDADIYAPYGTVTSSNEVMDHDMVAKLRQTYERLKIQEQEERAGLDLGSKVHPALWIASHCWTDSGREQYVGDLAQHMDVRVLGVCAQVARIMWGS